MIFGFSLEIFIDLEAMVAGVCYSHMAVSGDRQPLGSVEGVSRGVHKGQERPTAVKHLSNKSS